MDQERALKIIPESLAETLPCIAAERWIPNYEVGLAGTFPLSRRAVCSPHWKFTVKPSEPWTR
jgi:hypothetical protein